MTSQLHTPNNIATKATSSLSTASNQGMFQSRFFVGQSKKNNVQQPDLKTSLMQTENYGYHLHNMHNCGHSKATAVQAKKSRESGNAEVMQMAGPIRRPRTASSKRKNPYPLPANSQAQSITAYSPGQHGYRQSEQQRLSQQYGIPVSGKTHQSEHPIGFEPLNQTSGLKRGTPGRAYQLENKAPAYQEMYQPHRDHIGTGTHKNPDASGFNSQSYRHDQRKLLQSGDASSAVQINQLGYAFDPNFRKNANTPQGLAATNSYNTMANNMHKVEYAQGAKNVSVPVDRFQQQEMLLARQAAVTGQWPTSFQVNRAKMEAQSDMLLRGQQQRQQQLAL